MLIDIIKNVKEIKEIRDFVLDYLERYKGMVDNEYLKLDIYEKFHKKAETST